MDSTKTPPSPAEESVTLVIKRSSRNVFLAKIILFLVLALLGGHFFAQDAARQYESGFALTEEEYLARFDEHKGKLLSAKQHANPLTSTLAMLVLASFIIGSYELTALMIGFLIGKVIRR